MCERVVQEARPARDEVEAAVVDVAEEVVGAAEDEGVEAMAHPLLGSLSTCRVTCLCPLPSVELSACN